MLDVEWSGGFVSPCAPWQPNYRRRKRSDECSTRGGGGLMAFVAGWGVCVCGVECVWFELPTRDMHLLSPPFTSSLRMKNNFRR